MDESINPDRKISYRYVGYWTQPICDLMHCSFVMGDSHEARNRATRLLAQAQQARDAGAPAADDLERLANQALAQAKAIEHVAQQQQPQQQQQQPQPDPDKK